MSDNTRTLLALVLAALIGGVIGASACRSAAPEKVVETTKVEVITVETERIVERSDEKRLEELSLQIRNTLNQLQELKKSIHREKRSTTYPDGRVDVVETEDINIDRTVRTTEVKEVEKQVVVEVERVVTIEVEKQVIVDKVVEVEKIVTAAKPNWRASALLGTSLSVRPQLSPPYIDPLLVGAHVERRVIGPVFVGGWGVVDVKLQTTGFGVSVGAEW